MWKVVVLCVQCFLLMWSVMGTRTSGDVGPGEPLYVTPLLKSNEMAYAQEKSKVKPSFGGMLSYSGYFTVNESCESNLFFWFFPAQKNWEQASTVLWLMGGPGAASLHNLFEDLGPLMVAQDGTVRIRQLSWNVENNLLFIDQPVGSGYSFTGKGCYANNLTTSTSELYSAVIQFHQLFPKLRKNKFFIAGYSYAGHFIPALGHAIHKNNPFAEVKINLKGMMIGDGWMDSIYQNDLGSYLYQIGLIDEDGRNVYYEWQERFSQHMKRKEYEKALEIRILLVGSLYEQYVGNVSNENYLQGNNFVPRPYESFIQTLNVRKAIHVGNTNFTFINPIVGNRFGIAPILSVKPLVEALLENNYSMIFYYGQLDVICAYPMAERFFKALDWSGQQQYRNATRHHWCEGDQQVGHFKGDSNMFDVFVRNAGHSVPQDQPLAAFNLINSVTSSPSGIPLNALKKCPDKN